MEKKIKLHPVLTCKLDDSVHVISKKLKENKERRIFVIDNTGKLKGIITTTDLVYKVVAEENLGKTAKDIMTKEVASIDVSEDIEKALEIMNKLESFVCPITDKGKIIGLVSYHDLVGNILSSLK